MIKHIDQTGQAIELIIDHYRSGRIKGAIFIVKLNDGAFENGWTGDLDFLVRLGLLESAKADMILTASELV